VGTLVNIAMRQSVVSFHPTRTYQGVVVGLFAGSWGGTSGSVAARPGTMFLWSALNATGLLPLFNLICDVNMDVWTKVARMCHMF
jgi:hypothetical protein